MCYKCSINPLLLDTAKNGGITNSIYGLYSVLESAVKWLYSGVRMHCCIALNLRGCEYDDIFQYHQPTDQSMIIGDLNLTSREVDYLKVISMGCTAKEVALHIGKSPRSVEKAIFDLKNKLGIDTKDKLVCTAKGILVKKMLDGY